MIIQSVKEMQRQADEWRRAGKTIALVPTMGYLHDGHTSLMRIAAEKSDCVVTSIYVNPTQFGPKEDYASYPRDLEHDKKMAYENGTDVLFVPTDDEMYIKPVTIVHVKELTEGLCGASRPWHFDGVTTVVTKLFNIVKPHLAVFGQKDFQQARIIEKMVQDLNMDVEIVLAPIVREPDGLAMSSRNKYLSPVERKEALVLNQALDIAKNAVKEGERDVETLLKKLKAHIGTAEHARIDYVEIVDSENLKPITTITGNINVMLAVYISTTRLIDNCFIAV